MARVLPLYCILALCVAASLVGSGHANTSTISSFLASKSSFSRLTALLKKAKLDTAFTSKSAVTVFAPSNRALSSSLYNTLNRLPIDQLAAALKYHVVPGVFRSSSLATGLSLQTLNFAFPDKFTLIADSTAVSGSILIRGLYTAGKVVSANIAVGSSVIHEIDTVLLFAPSSPPKFNDIAEAAAGKGGLTVFANSLEYAYNGDNCPYSDLLSPRSIYLDGPTGTAFAVSDKAFAKWAADNKCRNSSRLPQAGFVSYSFSFDLLPPARLTANAAIATLNFYDEDVVIGPAQSLQVKYVNSKPVIWAQPRRVQRSSFFQANIVESIVTNKGVLHIIDNVLFPLGPGESTC